MEIEIVTTKKKLTLSIINQMPLDGKWLDKVDESECLGFIQNARKLRGTVFLLKHKEGTYFLVSYRWKIYEISENGVPIKTKIGCVYKYTYTHTFETQELRDSFLSRLSQWKETARQIYI